MINMPNDKIDWSAAPDSAIAWVMDSNDNCFWICTELTLKGYWRTFAQTAPHFNYPTAEYAYSLTVRPQE